MIAIVDYRAGNLTSVQRALEFLGHKSEITDRAERIVAADRVILPGRRCGRVCPGAIPNLTLINR